MKPNSFYQSLSIKTKGRNSRSSLFKKMLYLKEIPKTFSAYKGPPSTSRTIKQIPILSFPLRKNNNNLSPSSLFLTSSSLFSKINAKSQKLFNTVISRPSFILIIQKYKVPVKKKK